MKFSLTSVVLVGMLLCLASQVRAQGPTIDPSFAPTTAFAPAEVGQAIEQPDGKRLLVGYFQRVQGTPVNGLARLLPGGNLLDAVFQNNTQGLQGYIDQALLLPNGKILLMSNFGDSLMLGAVRRRSLLQLNSDGSPDAGFDAGAALPLNGMIGPMVVQPDGKIILAGTFTQFSRQPVGNIVRLNGNGRTDTGFSMGTGMSSSVRTLALQADGKLLIGGTFTSVNGQPIAGLLRVTSAGAIDLAFTPTVASGTEVAGLAVQPNGGIIVAKLSGGSVGGSTNTVVRLTPTGNIDNSFQLDSNLGFSPNYYYFSSYTAETPVQVLANANILLIGRVVIGPYYTQNEMVLLSPGGTIVPSFALPHILAIRGSVGAINSVQLLPNNRILVAGEPLRYDGVTSPLTAVAVLDANTGTRDFSLAPNIQGPGEVKAIVRQPDGKLIVAGRFNELNGIATGNVARLLPAGNIDPTFSVTGTDDFIESVALQPDGKVLLAGSFLNAGNAPRPLIARLNSSGSLDASFTSPLSPLTFTRFAVGTGKKVAVMPNGQVLLCGTMQLAANPNGPYPSLIRLDGATGQWDATFQPPLSGNTNSFLSQPNGAVVAVGAFIANGQRSAIWRLLPSGALDPNFTLTNTTVNTFVSVIEQDPLGRLYIGGQFSAIGSLNTSCVARFSATGVPDASFISGLSTFSGFKTVDALAIQPNGRMLLGGYFQMGQQGWGSARLLNNGTLDASYQSTSGPINTVKSLCIEPNGGLLMGGNFTQVSGLPYYGLVRLRDPNVLSMAAGRSVTTLEAWPVPTHNKLHLRLDPSARPQSLILRDALGRVAIQRDTTNTEPTLDTTALPAGVYVLSVTYATGVVSRRVVLE